MPDETTTLIELGDRLIQFGYRRKTEARGRVDFARRFSTPPSVVVTPFWEDAGREVGHAETIGRVTGRGFVLYSSNAASNYFVSWIAAGYARGGSDENVNYIATGDLVLEMGRTQKQAVSATTRLLSPFAYPPNIQVSPFWEEQRSGVGHAETVGRIEARSFEAWSDNRASNYYVSWIAAGTTRTDLGPREAVRGWFITDFPVGDNLLVRTMRGRVPGREVTVGLGTPTFAAPPTVIVTPFWEGQARGVGHAETLDRVEPHIMRLFARNRAANYHLSILAIGPRS